MGGRASIPALAIENIVEMAGLAMLVLLAQDVLGLDARGYGLLLACLAVGGRARRERWPRLHRRVGDQGSVVGSILLMSTRRRLVRGRPDGGRAIPRSPSGLTGRLGMAATLPRSRTYPGAGRGGVAQR
ncbi:MAG TPA: hypothetical protein VOA19_04120 [Actinomycetes bacterium]|nr:hypothetical protein [Actinomycetes bacterium]